MHKRRVCYRLTPGKENSEFRIFRPAPDLVTMTNATTEDDRRPQRRTMVDKQLRPRGISDRRVLDAMMTVPRELFVPPDLRNEAYENRALPLGLGQTISQPYIVAFMTQQLGLTPSSKTLEIGTGTGYQTAILALLSAQVYTVERFSVLKERARENLERLNLTNITMRIGDGSVGLPRDAPFDRILVTAAAPSTPPALVNQLVDGGVMVIPVGGPAEQTIVRVTRQAAGTTETELLPCRFVKLFGKEGWPARSSKT